MLMKVAILGLAVWWLLGGGSFGLVGRGRWGRLAGRGLAGRRVLLYRLFLTAVLLTFAVRLTTILWHWLSPS